MGNKSVSLAKTFALCFLWMMAMKPPLPCVTQGELSGPCAFFLGGFPLDVGTNNYLNMSTAKADFPPNGIDFPIGPTGRFNNGKNMADYIAMKIGRNFSPPAYLSFVAGYSGTISESDLQSVLTNGGLNFASGGGGSISDYGRRAYSQVVPIGTQVSQLEGVARDLQTVFNSTSAAAYLTRCVYFITFGSGSIANQVENLIFSDPSYIQTATSEYVTYVQSLYAIGARKFGVIGPLQIGCSPAGRSRSPTRRCNARLNSIAAAIPPRMAVAMSMLRDTNPGIVYSVANTYNVIADITSSPTLYGIRNVTAACCGNGTALCSPNSTLCGDRE